MEEKDKRSFNLEYLNKLLINDNAKLIGEYPKLNSEITIRFICSCNNEVDKLFKNIAYYGGCLL